MADHPKLPAHELIRMWQPMLSEELRLRILTTDQADGLISALENLNRTSEHVTDADAPFLQEFALQLALWDTAEPGKATWLSIAADDLRDAADRVT